MKKFLIIAILIFGICFAAVVFINPNSACLHEVYDKKLQVPLFTGFLTLGSFLLTLKTFVIVKLKESLYDTDFYKKRVNRLRNLSPTLETYAPLSRLATFLVYTVICALITAGAQMTVGFLPNKFAAGVCVSLAATTLFLVLYAWLLIKRNLTDLFKLWEEEDKAERSQNTSAQPS